MPAARNHLWRRERKLQISELQVPAREVWILHPQGPPLPAGIAAERVQVVLLDGSWREASAMAQELSGQARLASLPLTGQSRYWLRSQADASRFSTIEALMFFLGALGQGAARDELALQFELHVYANLRARGQKELAYLFLRDSPIVAAFPALLAQMHESRPVG